MQWLLKVEFSSSGTVLISVTFVLKDLRRILVGQRLPALFSQHDEPTYLAKGSTLREQQFHFGFFWGISTTWFSCSVFICIFYFHSVFIVTGFWFYSSVCRVADNLLKFLTDYLIIHNSNHLIILFFKPKRTLLKVVEEIDSPWRDPGQLHFSAAVQTHLTTYNFCASHPSKKTKQPPHTPKPQKTMVQAPCTSILMIISSMSFITSNLPRTVKQDFPVTTKVAGQAVFCFHVA